MAYFSGTSEQSTKGLSAKIFFPSLVPRLSWNANIYRTESLVSFVRKHDVSKIGQNRKATFACCSTNYASTLGVYDIRRPIARYV